MRIVTLRQGLGYLGDMGGFVALVASGRLDATPLISHRSTGDQLADAFHTFERQEDGIA